MPRAIAIETSGRVGSLAILEDGVVLAEETFPHGLKHAAQVIPILDRLTRARGWVPADVREVYVSAGPGSFTGLRVGVTVAKTLAFATGARVVAVPSVGVLARNAPPDAGHVVVVLDAKRDQVFAARFERRGDDWAVVEPAHLDTLSAVLARCPRPVHLVGEGVPYHRGSVTPGDAGVIETSPDAWDARVATVAELGRRLAAAGRFTPPDDLTPIYIRRPEAEEKLAAGEQKNQPRLGRG